MFDKRILCETGFGMPFKIPDVVVQPDRFTQIKFHADVMQGAKNLVCAGIFGVIADYGIRKQMVVLENFTP